MAAWGAEVGHGRCWQQQLLFFCQGFPDLRNLGLVRTPSPGLPASQPRALARPPPAPRPPTHAPARPRQSVALALSRQQYIGSRALLEALDSYAANAPYRTMRPSGRPAKGELGLPARARGSPSGVGRWSGGGVRRLAEMDARWALLAARGAVWLPGVARALDHQQQAGRQMMPCTGHTGTGALAQACLLCVYVRMHARTSRGHGHVRPCPAAPAPAPPAAAPAPTRPVPTPPPTPQASRLACGGATRCSPCASSCARAGA